MFQVIKVPFFTDGELFAEVTTRDEAEQIADKLIETVGRGGTVAILHDGEPV